MGLKQKIFADLEAACRPDAILSTNTSTIDISLVGAKTRAAERIVGAHFFSPAHIMPLLEIVRTPQTSKQARPQVTIPVDLTSSRPPTSCRCWRSCARRRRPSRRALKLQYQ